jgi:hypothetical protein
LPSLCFVGPLRWRRALTWSVHRRTTALKVAKAPRATAALTAARSRVRPTPTARAARLAKRRRSAHPPSVAQGNCLQTRTRTTSRTPRSRISAPAGMSASHQRLAPSRRSASPPQAAAAAAAAAAAPAASRAVARVALPAMDPRWDLLRSWVGSASRGSRSRVAGARAALPKVQGRRPSLQRRMYPSASASIPGAPDGCARKYSSTTFERASGAAFQKSSSNV